MASKSRVVECPNWPDHFTRWPLQAVDNRRLYRQIADQIAALIEKGEYAVGARLPPERDLASSWV